MVPTHSVGRLLVHGGKHRLIILRLSYLKLAVPIFDRDALASLAVKERISSAKFNKKRSREPEGPEPSNLLSRGFDSSSSSSPSGSKSSKGGEKARRLSFSLTSESAGSRDLPDLNHTLPMYTAELGSLEFPFYRQFHFADPIQTGSAPVIPSSDTDTTGSDPRLPSTVIGNINLDSLMFDHFTKEAVEAAGIPQIPPTADTYVIDALFHGHGQPQPQTQTQSILSMTGSSQESGMGMASESHLDFRSGRLDMSAFGMDFADFSEFAGVSSGDMSMSGSVWDDLPFNT